RVPAAGSRRADGRQPARRRPRAGVRQRRLGPRWPPLPPPGPAAPSRERGGLSAIALTTDPSVVTAISNDMGFAAVFRRQVEAHGRKGDVALGISTSGRSPNVVEALRAARARGLVTVGLTGDGGGELAGLVDRLIAVPHPDTQRVQEVHSMVLHVLAQVIEEAAERP